MKFVKFVIGFMFINSAFASDTIYFGDVCDISGCTNNYAITDVYATIFATSESKYTATLPGCFKSKVKTGEPFPYNYSYTFFENSTPLEVSMEDDSYVLSIENLLEQIKPVVAEVKSQVNPGCTIDWTVSVKVKGHRLEDSSPFSSTLYIYKSSKKYVNNLGGMKVKLKSNQKIDLVVNPFSMHE